MLSYHPTGRYTGPHLPDLVKLSRLRKLLRHLNLPVNPHQPPGLVGAGVPHIKRQLLRRNDGFVTADVVQLNGHGPLGVLVRHQRLGPRHARGRRVYGPRDPAAGFRRGGDECDGERSVGGVVGEVEEGGERGEVEAVGVDFVFEILRL